MWNLIGYVIVLGIAVMMLVIMYAIVKAVHSDNDQEGFFRDIVSTLFGGTNQDHLAKDDSSPRAVIRSANVEPFEETCPGCGETFTQDDIVCPDCGLRLVD